MKQVGSFLVGSSIVIALRRTRITLGLISVLCFASIVNAGEPRCSIVRPSPGWMFLRGETVAFEGTGNYPDGDDGELSYTWNIGGQSKSGRIVSHTFNSIGVFPVTLTANAKSGLINTSPVSINVMIRPRDDLGLEFEIRSSDHKPGEKVAAFVCVTNLGSSPQKGTAVITFGKDGESERSRQILPVPSLNPSESTWVLGVDIRFPSDQSYARYWVKAEVICDKDENGSNNTKLVHVGDPGKVENLEEEILGTFRKISNNFNDLKKILNQLDAEWTEESRYKKSWVEHRMGILDRYIGNIDYVLDNRNYSKKAVKFVNSKTEDLYRNFDNPFFKTDHSEAINSIISELCNRSSKLDRFIYMDSVAWK